jgi:hypothetical protein
MNKVHFEEKEIEMQLHASPYNFDRGWQPRVNRIKLVRGGQSSDGIFLRRMSPSARRLVLILKSLSFATYLYSM